MRSFVLVTTLCLLAVANFANSANILVVTPFGTKSHKNVFEPLLKALGQRGHQVTVIANTKSPNLGANVTEYVPMDINEIIGKFPNGFEQRKKGLFSSFFDFNFILEKCHTVFQDPEFNRLMNGKYDLVIFNAYLNVCFQGYLAKMGTPFAFVTSMAAPNTVTTRLGNWLPPSFVPNPFLPLSERMSFLERAQNFLLDAFFMATLNSYDKVHEAVYRKYLGEDTPGLTEIGKNVSLLLMNSYLNFPSPRPVLPDVIEVGGMHCVPAKPLPKDLEEFVSGAEHGFIFFSMGSVVKSKDMPEDTRKAFVNVFSRLKQRVLWKWDADMDDLPPNVKIGKWLPQQDLLGHNNTRLFITHGGLLSTQEAIYHGVPLLGIPVFIDQDLNMKQAEAAGFAVTLEILNMTEAKLGQALHTVLFDPRYNEKAKALSAAFQDQLQTPVDRAVFWLEYVVRHRGATHMRSAARDLNIFQYYCVDVTAFLASILIVTSLVLVYSLRKCYKIILGRKSISTPVRATKKKVKRK